MPATRKFNNIFQDPTIAPLALPQTGDTVELLDRRSGQSLGTGTVTGPVYDHDFCIVHDEGGVTMVAGMTDSAFKVVVL